MLSIRLLNSSTAIEKYLNKKAARGYKVESIVPFALFPPIFFTAFKFQKTSNKNRRYRIDVRHLEDEDKTEYHQLFLDDGWQQVPASINRLEPTKHIFYTDDLNKDAIFSDEESRKEKNKNEASYNLLFGIFLFCVFIFLQVMFPMTTNRTDTIIGFLSHYFYLIVGIITIVVSLYHYWRNK